MVKFETKRLLLRPLYKKDVKEITHNFNNINIAKHMASPPYPYHEKDFFPWLEKTRKNKKNLALGIVHKLDKKLIGVISVSIDKRNMVGKTGSWINEDYQGNGYITEVKISVNDYLFNILKLRKLISESYVENKASNKVQIKCGYVLEGVLRKEMICNATGKIMDVNRYGLFKSEWKKARPKLIKKLKSKAF